MEECLKHRRALEQKAHKPKLESVNTSSSSIVSVSSDVQVKQIEERISARFESLFSSLSEQISNIRQDVTNSSFSAPLKVPESIPDRVYAVGDGGRKGSLYGVVPTGPHGMVPPGMDLPSPPIYP